MSNGIKEARLATHPISTHPYPSLAMLSSSLYTPGIIGRGRLECKGREAWKIILGRIMKAKIYELREAWKVRMDYCRQ